MRIQALGQAGFVFEGLGIRLVVDPYLSDSVAEKYGEELRRQIPIVIPPESLAAVDWILLTHAHLDHTDPETLRRVATASPGVRFIAPFEVREILLEIGLGDHLQFVPPGDWLTLGPGVAVRAIPAAHVELERNSAGECRYVGFLFRFGDFTVYHAGDTIPHPEILSALSGESIDWAMLPVNERNYYRDQAGIVGNMSLREAFRFAADIGARTLVPIHWDLFAPNRTHPREIDLLYELESPPFSLEVLPAGAVKILGS